MSDLRLTQDTQVKNLLSRICGRVGLSKRQRLDCDSETWDGDTVDALQTGKACAKEDAVSSKAEADPKAEPKAWFGRHRVAGLTLSFLLVNAKTLLAAKRASHCHPPYL